MAQELSETLPDSWWRVQKIASNSWWVMLDTAVGFGSAFVSSILVARVLGPEKLGYYSYLLWVTSMLGSIGAFGVPIATRKYMAEYIGTGDVVLAFRAMSLGFRFQTYVAVAVVATGLGIVHLVVPVAHRTYATLAVCSLGPSLMMGIPAAANTAAEDFAANVWPSLISTTVGLAGVLLTLAFKWGLVGLAASMLVARCVDFVYRYLLFRRRTGTRWSTLEENGIVNSTQALEKLRKSMLRFCLQSSFLQLLTIVVWDRSELFFLQTFHDIRQVAFYSLPFNITQQLLLFPRVFSAAASANLLARIGMERDKTGPMAITMLRYTLLITLPLTFGTSAISAPVMRLVYGHAYDAAIPVLTILGLFSGAKAMVLPAQQLLVAMNRQDVIIRLTVAAGIFNIAADLLLIPHYGAVGAAVANSAAQTLAAAIIWRKAGQLSKVTFPWLNLAKLLSATVGMASIAFGLASSLPALSGAVFGILGGACAFVILLRWTGMLSGTDRERLLALNSKIPVRVRNTYRRGVVFVAAV